MTQNVSDAKAKPAAEAPEVNKTRGTRGGKRSTKQASQSVFFAVEGEPDSNGNPTLGTIGTEQEMILESFKRGVHYFRVQKFRTDSTIESNGTTSSVKIVGVPVE